MRELPCIIPLLDEMAEKPEIIVIDGYVTLGADNRAGLGMYLYKNLDESVPVIGVAKKLFYETPEYCQIFRGKSKTPLYITSAGISPEYAKSCILKMHGNNRIPTLLKKVDIIARNAVSTDFISKFSN